MEKNIEKICFDKQVELMDKYFHNGDIESEGNGISETIGDYSKDLPLKIEAEYRDFLNELWKDFSDQPLVLEEQHLRHLMTEDDREQIEDAYKKATDITLWERITKTNHQDVAHYRSLLKEYTKELLTVMRLDFLEEITGNHITGKAF